MTEQHVEPNNTVLAHWADDVIPRAVAYARSLLRSRHDAEDVVHDVLCRLLEHKEYDLEEYGMKILFRSVTNACINRWRRRRKILSLDFSPKNSGPIANVLPSHSAPDPADVAINRELHALVGQALAELPPNQRAALQLKALGHTLSDIAETLHVTATNAGVLVHRARKALALRMAPLLAERDTP